MTQTQHHRLRSLGGLAAAALVMAAPVAAAVAAEGSFAGTSTRLEHRSSAKKPSAEGNKGNDHQRHKATRPAKRDQAAGKVQSRHAHRQQPTPKAQRSRAQRPKTAERETPARDNPRRQVQRRPSAREAQHRHVQNKRPTIRSARSRADRHSSRRSAADRRTPRVRQWQPIPRHQTERRPAPPQAPWLVRGTKSDGRSKSGRVQREPAVPHRSWPPNRNDSLNAIDDRPPRILIPRRQLDHPSNDPAAGPIHLPIQSIHKGGTHHVKNTHKTFHDWPSRSFTYYQFFKTSCNLSFSLWYYGSALYTKYCAPFYRPWHHRHHYRAWYHYWPWYLHYGLTWPTYITQYNSWYGVASYQPQPCWATLAGAWELLAEGRAAAAHDAFDCLSQALPNDGLPMIGFALSAAQLDLPEIAVETMREAMRVDPESLLYMPDDDRLGQQILDLAQYYDGQARQAYGDIDALFMTAVLRYLGHEEPAAHYAIEVGLTLGDHDSSAVNLQAIIESALAENAYDLPPHD